VSRRRLGRALADRFSAPPPPWDDAYWPQHVAFVSFVLDSPEALALFARGERLPAGYGIGFDERVVEYPWLLSRLPPGRVLDAGSTLNQAHILDRVLPRVEELHIVTLAPEPFVLADPRVTYAYADLRDLPYPEGRFDAVVSVSTLEHVGMDMTPYGIEAPRAEDPAAEVRRAVDELVRVLAPGGILLATVPYGRREDHGWFRQFDRAEVDEVVAGAAVDVYRYGGGGWQVSSLEAAADEAYHDHHADPIVPSDRAAAARAVACLRAPR
jgi:SAM-dependent methyltransferase